MKQRVYNPRKVNRNIKDPTGFTIENNPYPYPGEADPNGGRAGYNWKQYFEWENGPVQPSKCHMCLKRAQHGSGNCLNGGEYFICLPKDVREGKKPYKKPVKTKQSKLW